MKFGYQGGHDIDSGTNFYNHTRVNYRFNNGVPNRLTMNFGNWRNDQHTQHFGLYAQDSWTLSRLTLQGALRFDHAWSHFPEQVIGPDVWIPTAIVVPDSTGIEGYNDISPRVGFAYDVFGNGRTSRESCSRTWSV